jgi:hypothetical protein
VRVAVGDTVLRSEADEDGARMYCSADRFSSAVHPGLAIHALIAIELAREAERAISVITLMGYGARPRRSNENSAMTAWMNSVGNEFPCS